MKRKAALSTLELAQVVGDEYAAVLRLYDFESVVLRSHLAVEGWLRLLLAIRLNVDTSALPRLSFSAIATLALAGLEADKLSTDVRKLNTLRNDIAHEFLELEYGEKMWPFVARLRRSTGRRRTRWIDLAKARFLRITGKVFVLVIKALNRSLSPEDLALARQQLPADMQILIDNPDEFLQQLDAMGSTLRPTLPDPSDITDVSAARAAVVAVSRVYENAMMALSSARGDNRLSTEDWAEVIAYADDLRLRGRDLMQLVRQWSDAGFEQAVVQQYTKILPFARWLQERAKRGAT